MLSVKVATFRGQVVAHVRDQVATIWNPPQARRMGLIISP
jgi:hypothetical protein